ncbi:hypothetical protein CLOHYLEM_05970 [[Clostridium] hylemonae DSM 15053]|uniref:Uncharacterized protein n=1 Tax=[Clostridium] hylemonae DSM 15053 TaxID=553973 RepID=C0C1F1_9FIRM|nr:hypothetical protein CLOHYLEM_05970 [[Clostridium] hylemonae DSM 15053]
MGRIALYRSAGYDFYNKIKNVPWHILAPSAVACDILHLRASAPPPEGFYNIGNEVSYVIKKQAAPTLRCRAAHA